MTRVQDVLALIVRPTGGATWKQLFFGTFTLLFAVTVWLSAAEKLALYEFLAGLAMLLGTTVLAVCVPWARLPATAVAAVPLLDVVLVALLRDSMRDVTIAFSLLVFVPTLWLVGTLRARGVWLSTLLVTLLFSVPAMVRNVPLDGSLAVVSSLLLPTTVLGMGLLVLGALTSIDRESARARHALTIQTQLLEASAAQESQLEAVLNSIDLAVVVVDRDGTFETQNPAMIEQGLRAQQLSGAASTQERDLLLRFPGTTREIPLDRRPVARAIAGESFSNYVIAVGPDGDSLKLSASARQITDHLGHSDGAVVVFSDVTELYESVSAQEQFVATVSHELRTPLTSVIGFLELAQDDEALAEDTAHYLQIASRSADQLQQLVETLLFTHVQRTARAPIERTPLRLSDLVDEACDSLGPAIAGAGLTLERHVQETRPVPMNRDLMVQALNNLLSNAVKYTPRGGTITVRARDVDGAVAVSVRDTGIGMTPSEQSKLFTRYYRTGTSREQHIPGHGIGLAHTRQVVLDHGGQLSVRSKADEGSLFTLWIPFEEGIMLEQPPEPGTRTGAMELGG
ncbi:sensor histidine kinase [Brachybacterium sp. J153]|uniref:sensor histidine kinase n=1 Tax=Brachybacterium sp. J153 TaxID=3116488 RepID=UPI002E779482|nr:ATP-binding protein [Brachybacterium sp. J153]MEE1617876.1 ATP-binding protein [Brachybacterium sp. J153]